jgi:predicted HTH domain antitoxin
MTFAADWITIDKMDISVYYTAIESLFVRLHMSNVSTSPKNQITPEAGWRTISEAALKVGKIGSLDDLLYHALNAWLEQTAPQLRWQIALELYITEQVSLGRAAEIAGLNYFVFLERLRDKNVDLVEADLTLDTEIEKQKALIHDVFNIARV